ncbi:MAG: hypothetical protein K2X38_24240 [Gemmataceae bacterium]|nr:hypothetical protein [Gemmataceae bacterium]
MGLPEAIISAAVLISCAVVAAWLLSRRREEPQPQLPPPPRMQPQTDSSSLIQQFANLGMGPLMEAPQSADGCPVEPSGVMVDEDTPLRVGGTVLSFSQARWWRAEIMGFEREGSVRIHFPGWDSKWDTAIPRHELQVDLLGPDADRDDRERMFRQGR